MLKNLGGALNPIVSRQAWQATVLRACRNCGAPGHWHATYGVNPGCYDPSRNGQPVGPICPQCGAERPPDEPQGVISYKETRVSDLIWSSVTRYVNWIRGWKTGGTGARIP